VSEDVASRLWPGRNPIGKRLKMGRVEGPGRLEVVGVAATTRYRTVTTCSWRRQYGTPCHDDGLLDTCAQTDGQRGNRRRGPCGDARIHGLVDVAIISSNEPTAPLQCRSE
jgi:hypothetical protein